LTNIKATDFKQAPGLDIHKMGSIRIGKDPKTSLLNKHNQLHSCNNVFLTDGSMMTSTSTQNPSLTYMAFTAIDFAISEMKKNIPDMIKARRVNPLLRICSLYF
jgi:choline dehydrogenase-like flavoprotein